MSESVQAIPQETEDLSVAQQVIDLYQEQLDDPRCVVPVLFLTGSAGTGKTYLFRNLLPKIDPKFALLASTTGISAVNLGTTTIHSTLKYYDTERLRDVYARGRLSAVLHEIGQRYKVFVIDEGSMMPGEQFEIIFQAVSEVNQYDTMADAGRKLGIVVTGDMCQLPPIKSKWIFETDCWQFFAERTLRLTKNYRQGNERFIEALNLIRAGDGQAGAEALTPLVHWIPTLNRKFDGTTVVATNAEVDRHNWLTLNSLPGPFIRIKSRRSGLQRGEWKNIPETLEFKDAAYMMLLSNSQQDAVDRDSVHEEFEDGRKNFFNFERKMTYANGDCGHVVGINQEMRYVEVELVRTGETVGIGHIVRENESREEPDEKHFDYTGEAGADGHSNRARWKYRLDEFEARWDSDKRRYIHGQITWVPLRVAYAATVHKVQGLTLDKIQIDSRAYFFGQPHMAYTALSRARQPENVYIVGSPKLFAQKVNIDPKVLPWI